MDSEPIAVGVPKHSSSSSRASTKKKEKKEGEESRGKRKDRASSSTRREKKDEDESSSKKKEEDSGDTRTKRREKEDRDAKRRARSPKPNPDRQEIEEAASSKKEEDSGDTRTKRREKEDRDAKRRARSSSNKAAASVPGAHASTGDHKSNRKSSKRSTGDDDKLSKSHRSRGSRSPKRDEKAAYRSSRSGSAPVPGAQAEASSPRRSKRDEKGKERRGTRATKPGAEASTSSKDKSKAKAMSTLNEGEIAVPGGGGDGDEPVAIAAMIVEEEDEEDDDEEKAAQKQARMREMIAQENERNRQRMEEENQRLREEMEGREAERKEKERQKKKRNITVCMVLLVLIGGGVGAYFGLVGGKSSSEPVNQTTPNNEETTLNPNSTITLTEFPSNDPSSGPTNTPTIFQKYDLPSEEECERIAAGLPLVGEEDMDIKSFDIQMDVELVITNDSNNDNDMESLVPELQTKLEQTLIPDLIGCPRDGFGVERRRRRRHRRFLENNNNNNNQDLNMENIRYAIAKADVSITVAEGETCQGTTGSNNTCNVLMVTIVLTVREEEKIFNLLSILTTLFKAGKNIRPDLQLQAPFDVVIVKVIQSNDPTTSPSIAPTALASENPSSIPSNIPSTSPTSAPVSGPITPAPVVEPTPAPVVVATPAPVVGPPPPTTSPSKSPSKAPTLPPTAAPTPTPPPTVAPQPGITSPPTTLPSSSPSISPSESPSASPSSIPSRMPSGAPSSVPSVSASVTPSLQPSAAPTKAPTTAEPTSSYLGCFKDDANRVLEMMPGGRWDVQGCKDFCRNAGYPYSAIQWSVQCFCGNVYDTLGPATNCNSACTQNPGVDQYCGGGFANSVYLTGAPLTNVVPALESNLDCGCTQEKLGSRDLPHLSPYTDLTQVGCIHYCKSQNYKFAGLQWVNQCFCGNDGGKYGSSLNCFTVDKNRDGISDVCLDWGHGACYDDPEGRCECGGGDANNLFRTSHEVSCPSENLPPTFDYLGCKIDKPDRDLPIGLSSDSFSIAQCRAICKDLGFLYSAIQIGGHCFCGNTYGNHGSSGGCNSACRVDSSETGCGGAFANSVYWSGAAVDAPVADLESNLHCGCTRDVPIQRDLEHRAPYTHLGQKACILYCRGKGYNFAGLQFQQECFCGNNPGTHSFSESCDMECLFMDPSVCYDGSSSCTCGGKNANDLFRTSTQVSCPSKTPESYTYLGCYRDDNSRVMETYVLRDQLAPACIALCRELKFPFAGLQAGSGCFCGKQYASLGTANNCGNCMDGSVECGGGWANSVYATGSTDSVAVLEDDLYCGCTMDVNANRDLTHVAPYRDLSQTGCIYYCKSKGYKFAGLQWVNECWCGNSAGKHGPSFSCDTVDKNNDGNRDLCYIADENAGCYSGTFGCSCGGGNANSLFRTSRSVACPIGASLISKDFASASFNVAHHLNHVAGKAIDLNTCGHFFACQSVAESDLSAPNNPALTIDLGFLATVREVVVWNREDCCWDRMNGLILELLDGNQNVKSGSARVLSSARQQSNTFSGMTNVRYIRLRRVGPGILNIAEVKAFS